MQTATPFSGHNESRGSTSDPEYDAFLKRINDRFDANMQAGRPLFTTDAAGLFDAYLSAFPESERQHFNCNTCRHFIKRFGGVVMIDGDGVAQPAFWNVDDAPAYYKPSVEAMIHKIIDAKVTGVFLSPEKVWGTPVTGDWHHLSVTPQPSMVFRDPIYTAGQVMAEKREDYKNVVRALAEYKKPIVDQALTILNSDTLYRAEKVIGPAQWLAGLHAARDAMMHSGHKANITWLAIAQAPAGFCHPRSSMIGTLFDDLAAGMVLSEVSRRFAAKMNPAKYQRPQTAPSAGNIDQAEKIMAKLGAAGSLARRYARLEELELLWKPSATQPEPGATCVFGHLKPLSDSVKKLNIPSIKMTWEKFAKTILPNAASLQLKTPSSGNYMAIVTAADPDAPPIMSWDNVSRRNPFSWYGYVGGATAKSFSLPAGEWIDVTGICLQPSMWHGHYDNYGKGAHFILKGAKDTRHAGACLFPELLKSEFHSVRRTIEAYSRTAKLGGADEQSATGYKITAGAGATCDIDVRVTDAIGNVSHYRIDRWD